MPMASSTKRESDAKRMLAKLLGYGENMETWRLLRLAAVHVGQLNRMVGLPEYILAPPGVIAEGEDFLSPRLEVERSGRILVAAQDEVVRLTQDFRLFYRRDNQHKLPWEKEKVEDDV